MSEKETVTVNLSLNADTHRQLRLIAAKTGLTNSEIVTAFLTELDFEKSLELLRPTINLKKNKPAKLSPETKALSPERVQEILSLLKKK